MNLHCDTRADGSRAFYIDGDLQFDTADEALYHEALTLPALSLLRKFKPDSLRVLICGGGDGLALREALRFPGVASVDLVDYSAEVVEWGRTQFRSINDAAFEDARAHVHIGDAWDYLNGEAKYDAVFCDFTVPRKVEDSRVFTREWYARIHAALAPHGVAAFNGVSAQYALEAFGSIVQSAAAAGLHTRPYRVCIPSFRAQGYGAWGFVLAAHKAIGQADLRQLDCPVITKQADLGQLWRGAKFTRDERRQMKSAPVHTLERPVLLPLLLNPASRSAQSVGAGELAPIYNPDALLHAIPILHASHTRDMVESLAAQVMGTVQALDLRRLTDALLRRAAELPREICDELRRLREFLGTVGARIAWLTDWSRKLFVALVILMTLANTVAPDTAYGKGSAGIGHASVGRGYSSFGGAGGYSSSGRGTSGSFGGKPGFGGTTSGGKAGSFGGTPGYTSKGGSFGGAGVPTRGPAPTRPVITSNGFRSSYGRGRPTDIYGYSYEPRVYIYYHGGGGGYYGGAQGSNGGARQGESHQTQFVADDDLLVMDNGDLIVPVSDAGYLLVVGGAISLYSKSSPEPLLALYPDSRFFQTVAVQLEDQQQQVQYEIGVRKDWLSWVGWTSALAPNIRDDKAELAHLEDLDKRLTAARQHLVLPPENAAMSLPDKTAVELFLDCILMPDGRVAFRTLTNGMMVTDGKSMKGLEKELAIDHLDAPPALRALIVSVMDKLVKESDAESQSYMSDLSEAKIERDTLVRDLAEYNSILARDGDANEDVDYGTEEIPLSAAIDRTNADLAQNEKDIEAAQTGYDKSLADRKRLLEVRQTTWK